MLRECRRATEESTRRVELATRPLGGPAAAPAGPSLYPELAELVGWYERVRMPGLAALTRKAQRSILRRALKSLPSHPGPDDLRAYLAELDVAPQTANRHLVILRALYRLARDDLGTLEPTALLQRRRVPEPRPRALRDPAREFPELLEAAGDARARALLLTLRYQGLRIGEALGLEWDDLDLDAGRLHVRQQRLVTRAAPSPLKHRAHGAWLPLHPLVSSALAELARGRRPLRGAKSRYFFPYYQTELGELLARLHLLVPKALPRRHGWHVLRHTYATELLRAGTRLEVIGRLLRHSSIAETQHYCAQLRRAAPVSELELRPVLAQETRERALIVTRKLCPPMESAGGSSHVRSDYHWIPPQALNPLGGSRPELPRPDRVGLDSEPAAPFFAATWARSEGERSEPERTARAETRRAGSPASRDEVSHRDPRDLGNAPSSSWSSTLPLRFPPWPVTAPPCRPGHPPQGAAGAAAAFFSEVVVTIIEVRDSSGVVARCDATCHNALEEKCTCVCKGRYHGKGRTGGLGAQLRADGEAFLTRLAKEAGGSLGEDLGDVFTEPLFTERKSHG